MARDGLIRLGRSQFIVIAIGLLSILLVGAFVAVSPYALEGLYLHYAWGPTLQHEFGFTVQERTFSRSGGTSQRYLIIATTVPGGVLDRSGVRSGDVPLNCHHDCVFGFYNALMAAREGPGARLRVLSSAEFAQENGDVRVVTILSPSAR